MGSWGGEDMWQGGGSWTRISHIRVQISWEEQLGSKTDQANQGSSVGNYLKTTVYKNVCGLQRQGNPQFHRRVYWRGPHNPRTYTNPPTWELAPEGAQSACGKQGKWQSRARAKQAALFSLTPPPHIAPQDSTVGCPALVNTKGSTHYNVTAVLTPRNMAQMKEQIKTPEKELSNKEIANLSDAEFKMLVMRCS